jgi:hypothetical protein
VGAPPPQQPAQPDPRDLREIKARQVRTEIARGIKIAIETATERQAVQARPRHARRASILIQTTTDV